MPRWIGSIYRDRIHGRIPDGPYGKNLAWNASLNARDRYLDALSFFPALHRERKLFAADFLESAQGVPDPLREWQRLYDIAPAKDRLSRLLYLDTKTYLNGDILTKVDRMSMATSLEVRVPMLDHEFVEWVTSLPLEWKFRAGARKHILKKLAERVGIPSGVVHRRKQGFQLPLVEWMRDELKGRFWNVLLEPRTLQRGYFKPGAVKTLIDEHTQGRRNRSGLLWRMLVLEMWHRNFLESKSSWGAARTVPSLEAREFRKYPAAQGAPLSAASQ
jgi:asparagine synthase (glutamine-hydrolysing)